MGHLFDFTRVPDVSIRQDTWTPAICIHSPWPCSRWLSFKKPSGFCEGCEYANQCTLKKNKSISVWDDQNRDFLKSHIQKCRSEEFKDDYRHRKAIVEPVFGNIKNKGIKIYHRGNTAISLWWKIVCSAHNIEKIVKSQLQAGGRSSNELRLFIADLKSVTLKWFKQNDFLAKMSKYKIFGNLVPG